MSYLNLPSLNLVDIQKGTISLWFRFSQDAKDAAKQYAENYEPPDFGDGAVGPAIFKATIPLVTFGRKVMAQTYGSVGHLWSQAVEEGVLTRGTFDHVVKDESPCEPSHLGLEVRSDDDAVTLKMVFQTETRAEVQGLNLETTDVHWELNPAFASYDEYSTVEDISFISTGQPESFSIKPRFEVEADQWHHLLLSFDFSEPVNVVGLEVADGGVGPSTEEELRTATIQSWCKLWYAFDDENRSGEDNIGNVTVIPGFEVKTTGWVPQDVNGIIPQTADIAVVSYTPPPPDERVTGATDVRPEYHWGTSPLPLSNGPMGFPASAEYVETIYHCEMAEFQFFADVVIDTGDQTVRRAFVDADGNPVPPTGTRDDPPLTERLLGKKPDILLHGTSNWQDGRNTGTTGVEINTAGEEVVLPSGQFVPTAKIEKYKPEPALREEPPTA